MIGLPENDFGISRSDFELNNRDFSSTMQGLQNYYHLNYNFGVQLSVNIVLI